MNSNLDNVHQLLCSILFMIYRNYTVLVIIIFNTWHLYLLCFAVYESSKNRLNMDKVYHRIFLSFLSNILGLDIGDRLQGDQLYMAVLSIVHYCMCISVTLASLFSRYHKKTAMFILSGCMLGIRKQNKIWYYRDFWQNSAFFLRKMWKIVSLKNTHLLAQN